jgi:hypothetical protein
MTRAAPIGVDGAQVKATALHDDFSRGAKSEEKLLTYIGRRRLEEGQVMSERGKAGLRLDRWRLPRLECIGPGYLSLALAARTPTRGLGLGSTSVFRSDISHMCALFYAKRKTVQLLYIPTASSILRKYHIVN